MRILASIPIYQVDAFTDKLFSGNPAAICPLNGWLPDSVMQAIAAENNLSENTIFDNLMLYTFSNLDKYSKSGIFFVSKMLL